VHRPFTNYLDAATCEVVHVPSFMALRPRRECGARDWVEARYRQK
jgi:hypothetical protein